MKKSQRADSIIKNVFKSVDDQIDQPKTESDINDLLASTLMHSKVKIDFDKERNITSKNCTITKYDQSDVGNPYTQKSISPPPYSPLTPLLLRSESSKICDLKTTEPGSSPVRPMTPETLKIFDTLNLEPSLCETDNISDTTGNDTSEDEQNDHCTLSNSNSITENSDDSVRDPDYVDEDVDSEVEQDIEEGSVLEDNEGLNKDEYIYKDSVLEENENFNVDKNVDEDKDLEEEQDIEKGSVQEEYEGFNKDKYGHGDSVLEENENFSVDRNLDDGVIQNELNVDIDQDKTISHEYDVRDGISSQKLNTRTDQERTTAEILSASLKRRASESELMQQPSKRIYRSSSSSGNLYSLQKDKDDLAIAIPKKKRVGDPAKWKRRIERDKRLKGQAYKTVKGKCKEAKPMKQPKCETLSKHQCTANVPEALRKHIYEAFRSLKTLEQQRTFIIKHVTQSLKKRETTSGPSRKKYTNHYSFTVGDNKKVKVCREFFLDTLNITDGMVRGALKKVSSEGTVLPDERGRRVPFNKLSTRNQDFLEKHIFSFPAMESHYCRKNSQYRYLDAKLNVKTMYRLYKEKCEEEGITPVGFEKYRLTFRSYKLRFHVPKKDLCKKCTAYSEVKDDESSCSQKELRAQHLNRKESAFLRRDSDKAAALSNTKTLAFNFDLESVLQTPKGAAGPFFYSRKLAVYNLTFYNLGNQDVDCYTWEETEGKRGSIEIATAVYKYINSKPGITHVRMMSDNCGGQQKNYNFCCMLLYLVANHPTIEMIDHVFFETGHSHMECDSIHSKIEQKSKYTPVFTPDGWVQIMRMARINPRPYNVITLLHDDFIDFNTNELQLIEVLPKKKVNRKNKTPKSQHKNAEKNEEDKEREEEEKRQDNGNDKKFKKSVWFQYRKQNPNSVFFKLDYENDDSFAEFKLKGKRGKSLAITFNSIYTDRLPISKAKKNDLMKLCRDLQIPRAYHQYYENLPCSNTTVDRLPEPDVTEE